MRRRLLLGLCGAIGVAGAAAVGLAPPKLSPRAIEAAVIRAEPTIEAAWRLPVAASFRPGFTWQSNPSLCGPASVANVLRSFGEPASTEADVLAGTGRCWSGYCILGLTLDQLAEVARKHTGRTVSVLRDLSAEQFREHLRHANDIDRRYIINFSRAPIFGAGVGHHSPIGGYLESEDLVFVLDVNPQFRVWLIDRSRLFAAMDTRDGDTKRGLLLIQ